MIIKKGVFWLALVILLMLPACSNSDKSSKDVNATDNGNFNEEGMPIVDETVSYEFMTSNNSIRADDWNEVEMWKKYEDMTNVEIDWGLVPSDGLEEKRSLALNGGNYPDAFFNTGMPMDDINDYGNHGTFIKLNDLIDKHMPNLKALMEEDPSIEKGITFPDGNIYSLPHIKAPDFETMLSTRKPFVRQDWLEQLGMDMPKTTDDFYEYLTAVKETDLNGNGEHDEIPYADSRSSQSLIDWLKGAYGLGTRGSQHPYIDVDPETDELRFFPASDGYKEMMEYMHKLYDEGLILENIFSIETNNLTALGQQELIGATVDTSVDNTYGMTGDEYVGAPQLTGPDGYSMWTAKNSPITSIGNLVITDKAENPAVLARWADHFYGDEGSLLINMGMEGVTYESNEDGTNSWTDEMEDNPEGLTLIQALKPYVTGPLGGGHPTVEKKETFQGGQTTERSLDAMEILSPDSIDEVWAPFNYTNDEQKQLSPLEDDIEKYVDEMKILFISGDEPLSNWDTYVETMEKMGLEDYMEIKQAALDRYQEN